MVVSLIECINIYEDAEIEVVFRHKDQFADVMKFLDGQSKQPGIQNVIQISKEVI